MPPPETVPPLVVIVAFHNTDDLAACLSALDGWGHVVIVDNGGEAAVKDLASNSGAEYASPGANVGFAAAVNIGLRYRAPNQHVLLLNPDARVAPGDAARLLEELESRSNLAAVAPLLKGADGRPQRAVWPVPSPREVWIDSLGLGRWIGPKWHFLVGAVLLLRAEAIDQVGSLDERFFLYAEECDWQLRAQRLGWNIALVESVTVLHVGGASSADKARREVLFFRAGERFGRKWYGGWGWAVMRAGSVLGAVRRWATAKDPGARREHALRLKLAALGTGKS